MKSKTIELRLSDANITFHKEPTTAGITHCIPAKDILKGFGSIRIDADGVTINIIRLHPSKDSPHRLSAYIEIHEVL